MFSCEAWAHILDEKRKALRPKSEKCIFVGYSEDVKGYRLLQPHSHDIIIRGNVKFDENLLAYAPNLAGVPSLACEPDSTIVPSSSSNFLNRFPTPVFDDDNEDENPPPPAHVPPIAPTPIPPQWVRSHVKQLVILSVILEINDEHVLSFSEPLLFWLKFLRIMIQKLLQKLQEIQIGMQLWMKNILPYWRTILGILYLFQKEENLSDVDGSIELSLH